MRKVNKASYGKDVLKVKTKPLRRINSGAINVVDGGWLLHQTKWKSGMIFNEVFTGYHDMLSEIHGNNSIVVFDDYNNGPMYKRS